MTEQKPGQPVSSSSVRAEIPPAATNSSDYYCYACRISIRKEEAKYCWDTERLGRFGGKAYCRSCQKKFPGKPRKEN